MVERLFQLDRKDIVIVQYIIEAHGRMSSVQTLDSRKAVIRISILPDFIAEMNDLIDYLKEKYKMIEI